MLRNLLHQNRFRTSARFRLLAPAVMIGGLFGCTTITIPVSPIGTAPSVSLTVEADRGSRQAALDVASCVLGFNEFANPVVVIATGRDSDEGVKRIRLHGEVTAFCGIGDCISSVTDLIEVEFVDDAVPGERGRISRNALHLISFSELNDLCSAESICGQLDTQNVNAHVRGEVENFHGQTSTTPLRNCVLDFLPGIIPPP